LRIEARTAAWFLIGSFVAILASFPLAVLCALVFRFPVPFVGYMSGPKAVVPALWAVLFYGVLLGGFLVLALVGGLGGVAAERYAKTDHRRRLRLCLALATLGSAVGIAALAILDKIIGPW
jgi:hypothetical protein